VGRQARDRLMDADLVLGSSLNEAEAFTKLLEALKIAESSCRQLALLRDQQQWLAAQLALERTRDLVTRLAQKGISRLHH
jgi:hypothetical protein